MLRLVKWILFALLLLIAVIVSFQNLTPIQLHFLFSTVELPQAVFLLISLLVGFILGGLAGALWRERSWRAKQLKQQSDPE
jgi:uncharacterized integral membrane protein